MREKLLELNAYGLYFDDINYLIQNFSDLDVEAIEREVSTNTTCDKRIRRKIREGRRQVDIEQYQSYMEQHSIQYTTIFDKDYPGQLLDLEDRPPLLYYKGKLSDRPGIAVVGSRKCTDYGYWACEKIIRDLSSYGINIISGLALGIDKAAHQAALKYNLPTTAVLGSGVDLCYPSVNQGIYDKILEAGGAIISELRLQSPPLPFHFPMRNRIVSGLSMGVLVIEAKEKSGTLITASQAAQQGREVFCIPGNINSIYSRGTNALIRDGAKLTTSGEDIGQEIFILQELKKNMEKISKDISNLSDEETEVYRLIISKTLTTDQIINALDRDTADVMATLTMLELKAMVEEVDGHWQVFD